MKSVIRLLLAFSAITFALAFSASAAPDYGAYHDALGQLRTARAYIELISAETGVPVTYAGVGPGRSQYVSFAA